MAEDAVFVHIGMWVISRSLIYDISFKAKKDKCEQVLDYFKGFEKRWNLQLLTVLNANVYKYRFYIKRCRFTHRMVSTCLVWVLLGAITLGKVLSRQNTVSWLKSILLLHVEMHMVFSVAVKSLNEAYRSQVFDVHEDRFRFLETSEYSPWYLIANGTHLSLIF